MRTFALALPITVVVAALSAVACDSSGPKKAQAQTEVKTIKSAAEVWMMSKGKGCPTMADLVADKQLAPGTKGTDPWNKPYRIECTDAKTVVASDGPDGKTGTADDITTP